MTQKQPWCTPRLNFYGNVEDITEQQPVGSISKSGGAGDTVSITIAGVSTVVASGASGGGGSIINTTRR